MVLPCSWRTMGAGVVKTQVIAPRCISLLLMRALSTLVFSEQATEDVICTHSSYGWTTQSPGAVYMLTVLKMRLTVGGGVR